MNKQTDSLEGEIGNRAGAVFATSRQRPKIAVVTAENIRNAGMYSVDCAALSFFRSLDCDFEMFVTQFRGEAGLTVEDQTKSRLSDVTQLDGFSHIVFWGDYLNNPVYGLTDFARRDMNYGHATDRQAGYARWADLFTFRQSEPQARVVSVGNNFQHDFEEKQSTFRPALNRLEAYFTAILPRDPFSAQNLSRALSFEKMGMVRQGMDCAFLLPPTQVEKKDQFCYFFGRSGFDEAKWLIDSVARKTGLQPVELSNWLSLSKSSAASAFADLRDQIAASRFAITDVYHLAINSFVQRIPVVGLGKRETVQRGTLGDFKKRQLFAMVGQSDTYFEMGDESEAAFFERIVQNGAPLERPDRFDLMEALAKKFRSDVEGALFA